MATSTQFFALQKEYKTNLATINRLKARNEQLKRAFDAIDAAMGKAIGEQPEREKRPLMRRGLMESISKVLIPGEEFGLGQLTTRVFGSAYTSEELNAVTNACGRLIAKDQLIRMTRGRYRVPSVWMGRTSGTEQGPPADPDPVETAPADPAPDVTGSVLKAAIGHDTRIIRHMSV